MHVLFVEDDQMNRRVVRDMLQLAGAAMTEAIDGASGLEMVEQQKFDLILMDLRMPGMDGLTAIDRIRSRQDAKAKTPIVVVTADAAVDMRERCLAGGANGVILKPVSMKELFDTMARIVMQAE